MREASETCSQPISTATPSAISSPASEAGVLPSGSRAFQTSFPFGPARVPASPSALPGKCLASPTTAISGRNSTDSSASDALQSSLESKLRTRLTGSVACEVIWKPWTTPWGACLSRPRARARTISGIDIGLWPTCTTPSGGQSVPPGTSLSGTRPDGSKATVTLQNVVKAVALSVWPTVTSNAKATGNYNEAGNSAGQVAIRKIVLALWPTATASDHKSRSASQETLERNARPLREVVFSVWRTLNTREKGGGDYKDPGKALARMASGHQVNLQDQVIGFSAAIRGDQSGQSENLEMPDSPLPSQISMDDNLSNAPTENGAGSLHPEFGGWELGYPPAWLSCAPSETQSTGGRRRHLSGRT